MSLLFNILSTLVITFLPRSKLLLFSWLQWWLQNHMQWFWSPPKIKSATISTLYPFICHEVMGLDAMMFVFWMLSFKTAFSFSSFTFIKRLFSSSSLSAIRVVSTFTRMLNQKKKKRDRERVFLLSALAIHLHTHNYDLLFIFFFHQSKVRTIYLIFITSLEWTTFSSLLNNHAI